MSRKDRRNSPIPPSERAEGSSGDEIKEVREDVQLLGFSADAKPDGEDLRIPPGDTKPRHAVKPDPTPVTANVVPHVTPDRMEFARYEPHYTDYIPWGDGRKMQEHIATCKSPDGHPMSSSDSDLALWAVGIVATFGKHRFKRTK